MIHLIIVTVENKVQFEESSSSVSSLPHSPLLCILLSIGSDESIREFLDCFQVGEGIAVFKLDQMLCLLQE